MRRNDQVRPVSCSTPAVAAVSVAPAGLVICREELAVLAVPSDDDRHCVFATHVERVRRAYERTLVEVVFGVADDAGLEDVPERMREELFQRQPAFRSREQAVGAAASAANAGVRQIVYLGGLGADGPDASPHLRGRRETGQRLASAGVPVTTLRAAIIIGKGSAAFETILGLVKRLPVMVTPSWVSTPTQPIALDDVARYLAGVCGNEAAYGEAYDTGGPEVMTYRQMIERIAALLGRKPAIVEVPVLTPYLSSLWLNLVTPVNASVARPLVEGLRNPTIAREERIRKLLPLELTPFDEAARQALA